MFRYKNLHNVDYKKLNEKFKPLTDENMLGKYKWVSVNIAAKQIGKTTQTIRLLYLTGQIKALKIGGAPVLVDLDEVVNLGKINYI
jgi:hypothetical protein